MKTVERELLSKVQDTMLKYYRSDCDDDDVMEAYDKIKKLCASQRDNADPREKIYRTERVEKYTELERKSNAILDEMDELWFAMNDDEQAFLNSRTG